MHVLVPHDIKNIMNCFLHPAEYMLWERQWKKHLKSLSDKCAKDANRQNLLVEEIAREGDFQNPKPLEQAKDLHEDAVADIPTAGKTSLFLTPYDNAPTQSFASIKQGLTKTFVKFID